MSAITPITTPHTGPTAAINRYLSLDPLIGS